GRSTDKFGLPPDELPAALELLASAPRLKLRGLAIHIGSQIRLAEDFSAGFAWLKQKLSEVRNHGFQITHLDLGGGLPVDYGDGAAAGFDLAGYAALIERHFADCGVTVQIEPGRFLVAPAG